MIQKRGRTSLGHVLELEGELYRVESLGDEPTELGYGYKVEVFQFEEGLRDKMDAAKATVFPNSTPPPQYVERDGVIKDYPMKGSGVFLCLHPDGELERISYDERDESQRNLKIEYGKGCYICWKVGGLGLELIEICIPPYQEGDLRNLDIDSDDVPEIFRQAFRSLISA